MNREAGRLARELRRQDLVTELGDETFRLKKSFEAAAKLGARYVLIVGENEVKSETVRPEKPGNRRAGFRTTSRIGSAVEEKRLTAASPQGAPENPEPYAAPTGFSTAQRENAVTSLHLFVLRALIFLGSHRGRELSRGDDP